MLEQATEVCPKGHEVLEYTTHKVLDLRLSHALFKQIKFKVKFKFTEDFKRSFNIEGGEF